MSGCTSSPSFTGLGRLPDNHAQTVNQSVFLSVFPDIADATGASCSPVCDSAPGVAGQPRVVGRVHLQQGQVAVVLAEGRLQPAGENRCVG